jgi:hypothetical protein
MTMPELFIAGSRWRTSSFGTDAGTLPLELADLGAHLGKCRHANGRLIVLQSAWLATACFVHARLVTTLLGVASLGGAIYLLS